MQKFSDFSSFVDFINVDAKTADFNPVRFINVETMSMWAQVKSLLTTNSQKIIKLSEFCQNDDIAPNINQLKKAIRLTNDSSLVMPLSEYFRINRPIASKVINDILHANFEYNSDGKLRVYILLYRMKDVLTNVQLNPKETKTVLYINEGLESDYSLTIVQKSLDISIYGNEIDGFKKYLVYWEQNPDKPIILRTQNAINYTDIVFSDNVVVIVSAYDLLHQYYRMTNELTKDLGSERQWQKFASEYSKTKNLDLTICTLLPASQYSDNLFEYWDTYDDFRKWLLWLWTRLQTKNEYLKMVSTAAKSVAEFEKNIFDSIITLLGNPRYEEFYNERKVLLQAMKLPVTSSRINIFLQLDPVSRMRCLTNRTKEEKQAILQCLSEAVDFGTAERVLHFVYPLAFEYLQYIGFRDAVLEEYFKAYRRCKIRNKGDDAFIDMVSSIAQEQGEKFWILPSRNVLVDQLYDDNTIILFVDSLGAEYVSALRSCFDEDIYDIDVHFGHSNLPSTTRRNSDFWRGKNHAIPYYDLDRWKHSNCTYPQSIVQELEYIQEIKYNVEMLLAENDNVLIAADHGSSRLAVLCRGRSVDVDETADKYKYGRYCAEAKGNYSALQGCIRYDEDEESYWIFANYDHFKQKGAPVCEIHGGASLEEMIVPVICVSKKRGKKQAIVLTVLTPTIRLPVDRKILVRFKSNQKLKNAMIVVDNEHISCSFADGNYTFEQIIVDSKTEYVAKVVSNNRIIGKVHYQVTRGMQKSAKFDI
ncbi:BREX-4 system phosphatase PglZ [Sporomusa acidovorans]|uniref:PglZ domain protein n=1 Tax=Sporomusa acidovorans (strain ATCC 49682 / DSM 3132 / Mol) TaxID=1123286 RepID=A0ABZ3J255_SPOA4|nr:BREX-4 system phosphatase PglZ [Sporomusa acidovorans]OZC13667.1 hypothetical protein SPACI_56480 [Sporomusa acidovorans DSM 3132]SDE85749.1 hypothetical protein SAMN04488499_10244 [Sporomusa acidovorans]